MAENGTHDSVEERLRHARAALELKQAEAKLRHISMMETRQKKLKESYEAWSWLAPYADQLDRMGGPDRDLLLPVSTAMDRRYGDNWPFWRSWMEHARLRAASRLLYQVSPLVQGALHGLGAYVVGDGMQAKATAKRDNVPEILLEAVQDFFGHFDSVNDWLTRQSELFVAGRIDGEWFLRLWPQDDGMTILREVLPEHVVEPPTYPIEIGKYGVLTDPEDLQDVRGYFLAYDGLAGNGQEVSSREVFHLKENVHRCVKRGLPDISYDALDLYKVVGRLLENMGQGAAIQAAIAFVRQHATATPVQIADFISSTADYQTTQPFTGNSRSTMRYEAGTIVDMDAGQQFVESPFAANVGNFVQAVQALLRATAVKWNAPEWLVSADNSSVNYASSLTSESPFVKRVKQMQRRMSTTVHTIVERALQHYCRRRRGIRAGGKLYPWEILRQLVEIQITPATVETRDRQQEASLNQTYVTLGVKSRQTVAAEQGLDFDVEERNNEEYEKKHGEQGVPGELRAGEGGGGPDDPEAGPPDGGGSPPGGPGGDAPPDGGPEGGATSEQGMAGLLQSLTEQFVLDGLREHARLIEAKSTRKEGEEWESSGRWYRRVNGKTVRFTKADKKPAAPKAPKGKTPPAPAPKAPAAGKVKPEAVAKAQAMLADESIDAAGMVKRLTRLTKDEILAIGKDLGLDDAKGVKAQLAAKVAELALAGRKKPEAEPESPAPAPQPQGEAGSVSPSGGLETFAADIGRLPGMTAADARAIADPKASVADKLKSISNVDVAAFDPLLRASNMKELREITGITYNEYLRGLNLLHNRYSGDPGNARNPLGVNRRAQEMLDKIDGMGAMIRDRVVPGLRKLAAAGITEIDGEPYDANAYADFYEKHAQTVIDEVKKDVVARRDSLLGKTAEAPKGLTGDDAQQGQELVPEEKSGGSGDPYKDAFAGSGDVETAIAHINTLPLAKLKSLAKQHGIYGAKTEEALRSELEQELRYKRGAWKDDDAEEEEESPGAPAAPTSAPKPSKPPKDMTSDEAGEWAAASPPGGLTQKEKDALARGRAGDNATPTTPGGRRLADADLSSLFGEDVVGDVDAEGIDAARRAAAELTAPEKPAPAPEKAGTDYRKMSDTDLRAALQKATGGTVGPMSRKAMIERLKLAEKKAAAQGVPKPPGTPAPPAALSDVASRTDEVYKRAVSFGATREEVDGLLKDLAGASKADLLRAAEKASVFGAARMSKEQIIGKIKENLYSGLGAAHRQNVIDAPYKESPASKGEGDWHDHPLGKEPTAQDVHDALSRAWGDAIKAAGGSENSAIYRDPWNLKAEVPPGVDADSVLRGIHAANAHTGGQSSSTLKKAYEAAKKEHPGLTVRQFQETVKALEKEGKVQIGPFTRPGFEAVQSGDATHHFIQDREVKGYVSPSGKAPPPPKAPASPKEATPKPSKPPKDMSSDEAGEWAAASPPGKRGGPDSPPSDFDVAGHLDRILKSKGSHRTAADTGYGDIRDALRNAPAAARPAILRHLRDTLRRPHQQQSIDDVLSDEPDLGGGEGDTGASIPTGGSSSGADTRKPRTGKPPAYREGDSAMDEAHQHRAETVSRMPPGKRGGPGSPFRAVMRGAYESASMIGQNRGSDYVFVPDLYEMMKRDVPNLTPEEFKAELGSWWKKEDGADEGRAHLLVMNEVHALSPEQRKVVPELPDNDRRPEDLNTYGYVYMGPPKPSRTGGAR